MLTLRESMPPGDTSTVLPGRFAIVCLGDGESTILSRIGLAAIGAGMSRLANEFRAESLDVPIDPSELGSFGRIRRRTQPRIVPVGPMASIAFGCGTKPPGTTSMNVLEQLRARFAAATPEGGDPQAFASAIRPSTDPKFGEYQANGSMAIAKRANKNPREVAQGVAEVVDLAPMAGKPEVAGPGFLNVRLLDDWISRTLGDLLNDPTLGVTAPEKPKTVVIDYSSPNVAKPMHVGHLRSTVIGESLARIFGALGHKVIRDNHLGDWGSQFGMILWGWKNHRDEAAYAADPVTELARLYRLAQARIKPGESLRERYGKAIALDEQGKADEAAALFAKLAEGTVDVFEDVARKIAESRDIADATRAETVKLHAGDFENRVLWEQFMPHCLAALQVVYDRLDIHHDVHLGESFYDQWLAGVVEDLEAKGLAVESKGATVVFSEGFKAPFIVRKSDGAYNYATTDLATIRYRDATWRPDLLLYVVDHRQGDHFKQLFAVAKRWGYGGIAMEHVAFGTVLGQDRRPYKTRDGDVIGLESLLDGAIAEARKVVDTTSAHLPDEQRRRISEVVGLGAIKYADLSQNRLSDYVFDMAKMVALNGNTATYLQYAYARIRSIFRKGGVTPEAIRQARPPIALSNPAERGLAVRILRFPETLEFAAADLKPNILADYLFDLASAYSTFNEECPVLKAESPERRDSRLALIDLAARTLESGLKLLGIGVVEEM
jgi:arginyl-tRNA synthetase